MNARIAFCTAFLLLAAMRPPAATAGPDWVEDTDAGSFPGTAQAPKGVGQLTSLYGTLGALNVAGRLGADMEDMYIIAITDPVAFSADTIVNGMADFDTQLWLFHQDGRALLANDNTSGLPGSFLLSQANDGTGQTIPGRGVYYLAITGFDNDPQSSGGLALFDQASRDEVSGPDGFGGSQILGKWGESEESGTYVIALNGAAFPPGDCDGDRIFDPDDDDLDNDGILNVDDACDYTPKELLSRVISDPTHPLFGSVPCDLDGDCDCDLRDYAEFQRYFGGIGCADGQDVTDSPCAP